VFLQGLGFSGVMATGTQMATLASRSTPILQGDMLPYLLVKELHQMMELGAVVG